MSEHPTREEVLASIVARSDQINAEDLIATGPITVTVKGVRRGSKEQPIQIDLVERDRPYRPCKTVRRTLIALWSDDPETWVGKQLTIYTDPTILYMGVRLGGLRVSHVSGINEPKTLLLTKTRGQRAEVTIHPIAAFTTEEQEFIDAAKVELETAEDMDALKAYGQILKGKSQAVRDALRPVAAKRKKELTK